MTYYSFPGLRPKARMEFLRIVTGDRKQLIKERFRRVIMAIERVTDRKWADIRGKSRKGILPILRAIIGEYVYQPGLVSKQEVANLLGLKDHTSINHFINSVIPGVKLDDKYLAIYNDIHKYL